MLCTILRFSPSPVETLLGSLAGQKTLQSDRPSRKLATCCKGCCKRGSIRTGAYMASVIGSSAVPKT